MTKTVTIFGGSGFVGSKIAELLVDGGWTVRAASRKGSAVKGADAVTCNITNGTDLARALDGVDAVINCVGTFDAGGANGFDAVQARAPAQIAQAAKAAGITRMVHISALGVDRDEHSKYAQSKRAGEEGVLGHLPNATILRPSVIFGPGDGFFNRFEKMTRLMPILPIPGGDALFQPVYVGDVAKAAMAGLGQSNLAGVFELGGPEVKSMKGWIDMMHGVIGRRRAVISLPLWMGSPMAWALDLTERASRGVLRNGILTRDQVNQLRTSNVVAEGARDIGDLGIEPVAAQGVLESYL